MKLEALARSGGKARANECVEACLHTQRVQPSFKPKGLNDHGDPLRNAVARLPNTGRQ